MLYNNHLISNPCILENQNIYHSHFAGERTGTVVTLTLSRGANYGYDQRCEVFGTTGLVSITNTSETSTCLANSNGVHLPKLQHSFPQRFEVAFANEIDAFADTLLLGTSWPVSEEDCVAVQKVCDCALLSCESGEVVRVLDQVTHINR